MLTQIKDDKRIVVHVDRSVTVISDGICWQPLIRIDILAEAFYQVISVMIFLCLGACNARTVHQCHHQFLACVMPEVD